MSAPNLSYMRYILIYLLWLSIYYYYSFSSSIFNEAPVSYDVEKCQDEKMMIPFFSNCDISVLWAVAHKVRTMWPTLRYSLSTNPGTEARKEKGVDLEGICGHNFSVA